MTRARGPARLARGPCLPDLPGHALVALTLALLLGFSIVATRAGKSGAEPAILIWPALTLLAILIALSANPLLRFLAASGKFDREPTIRNWLLYYGTYLATGMAGGIAFGLLQTGLDPAGALSSARWLDVLMVPASMVALAWEEEVRQAERELLAREDAGIEEALAEVLAAEEALVRARTTVWGRVRYMVSERAQRAIDDLMTDLEAAHASADEGLVRRLADLADRLDAVAEDVRQASHLLHPSVLVAGLLPALRSLASAYHNPPGLTVVVRGTLREAGSQRSLAEKTGLAIYRFVEEALDNARRHSGAGRIEVVLDRDPSGRLVVEIQDEGVGFAVDEATRGIGFQIMASRMTMVGGTWEVVSAPGAGTRVRAMVPVGQRAPERAPGIRGKRAGRRESREPGAAVLDSDAFASLE